MTREEIKKWMLESSGFPVTQANAEYLERFQAIAFKAGAASRDAEVSALEFSWAGCSQQLKDSCADLEEVEQECDQLRAELVKALAACKVKDEALASCGFTNDSTDSEMCGSYYDAELVQRALAIKPDDSALKAWLGAPVAWADAYGNVIRKSTKEFSRNVMTGAYSIALYSPTLPLGETK